MDFLVIDGKKYTEEQVRELFLNGEDDGDISDTPTIDSNHDSEEEYTIDDDADVAEVDDQAEQVPVDDLDFHASAENSSDSDSSSDLPLSSVGYVYGKNRYKWSKRAPTLGRTRRHNIITHLPGLKAAARNLQDKNPVNYWSLLITDEMISTIVDCTNEKITDLSSTYGETASFVNFTDSVEMKAFFGLLYLTSAFKSNHEDVEGLFASDGTGRDIFRATMSLKRFMFLLVALRFDSISTRSLRKTDKFCHIREIFETFIQNCRNCYTPGESLTIDEMLVGFRGRCSFRVYMKNKPNKYGLKVLCLCDAKTHYLLNAFVYTGKSQNVHPNPRKLSVPTLSVLSLIDPVKNTNRNITADNWFTSIELVEELRKNQLTYVGTVRKNKKEIPQYIVPNKRTEPGTSMFVFTSTITLVSYVPKPNKYVLLLSSMHHDNKVDEGSSKPDMILYYNSTKAGVDALDQKCANYNTGRRTRRWPCAIWYAVMNIASVNSFILFQSGTESSMRRRNFIIQLGQTLIETHMRRRLLEPRLPRELRSVMERLLKCEDTATSESTPSISQPRVSGSDAVSRGKKRRRCYICPSQNDNKHATMCNKCNQHVCKIHSAATLLCEKCQM
ncbi:hypothetical protein PPYR_01077 [Photinus pyralis]|uniref:PiggyBac transposable element-derived protein domain-containing protein n=1 Tax=Photinus pyralis TaxID=7054 RepID=A0A1Y1LGT7_PHOPY|nr:piggyBac transposable element-derived protein 3-like [Photinus pyralis]KAB0804107.1 hypothetical protein PPYR_01077 [Photinus pyralis]